MRLNSIPHFPKPENAPLVHFRRDGEERTKLVQALHRLRYGYEPPVLPLWIGGRPLLPPSGVKRLCVPPHDYTRILGYAVDADDQTTAWAIEWALRFREEWSRLHWSMRLHIFRRAAYLLQTKYFYDAVAVVMEDYSKNPFEAMIDVVELVDFWNFNVWYAYQIYQEQPDFAPNELNLVDYRPWEGFIAALPPNNFISIALNLPTAPIIMGNVAVVKPAPETVFSFHFMLKILQEAGLPMGVLSVVQGDEEVIGEVLLSHPDLAHIHFTGSMDVMHMLRKKVAENIERYKGFPEVVGESGGKNFMLVYDDEDPEVAAAAAAVGGFGYQGRKCSAASRVYMSEGMWGKVKPLLRAFMSKIKVGDVADFRNYLGAIISQAEYKKIVGYIERAKGNPAVEEVMGGDHSHRNGWWVHPTVIVVKDPHYETMVNEIFGPVVSVFPIPEKEFERRAPVLVNTTSVYRLTGAVLTKDVLTLCHVFDYLRYAAGNVYDWKTTGAVVNRQPFGGSGKSGSNTKPGSKLNLYRWVDPRSISLLNSKPAYFAPPYLDLEL